MASRIQQGVDGQERLYTVRPRNVKSITKKRGSPSSIKFNLPDELRNNPEAYETNLTSAELSAFRDSINGEDGLGFINFITQSLSYSIQEKSQIMHTFGGQEAVYFYGKAPVMVQLTGTIVDDIDNDQFTKFLGLYNKFLRGSQASKEYAYVTLDTSNVVFIGSFLNISVQQSSDRDTDVNFSAQFLAKTFTLRSSDMVFADGEGNFTSDIRFRDPDPTLTRENIQAIIEANNREAVLQALSGGSGDSSASLVDEGSNGFFGEIPRSFGKLPTLDGLIGFSAADITEFFDSVADTITDITAPVTDLVNQIDDFSKDVIGALESVEKGIDDVLASVDSVTNQVFGAIDSIDNAVTKLVNFPQSISSKLSHIGKPGGTPLKVIGSPTISSSDGTSLILSSSNMGATRGTDIGVAAKLSLSATTTNAPGLSTTSSSEDAESSPSLSIGG